MSEEAVLIFKWFGVLSFVVPLAIYVIWKNMRSLNDVFDEMNKLSSEQKASLGWPTRHMADLPPPAGNLINNFENSFTHASRGSRATRQVLYRGMPSADIVSENAQKSARVFQISSVLLLAAILAYFLWMGIDLLYLALIAAWLVVDVIRTPRWPREKGEQP